MYLIDQEIANKIAKTVLMKYPMMTIMFMVTEEQADAMEAKIRADVEKETGDDQVARAVAVYLPLYLENQAITKYIAQTKNQSLRSIMPEILTAEEMALMAQQDMMFLTKKQMTLIAKSAEGYRNRLSRDLMQP